MKQTRLLFFVGGIFCLTLGVTLTLRSSLGAGPWDALTAGQSKATGFTIGNWVILNGILLLFVNASILRERPQFLGIITFVCIGFMIDMWMYVIRWQPNIFVYQGGMLLCGLILLAFGVAAYMQAKYPINPIDYLMVALHRRFGVRLMIAKMIGEALALTLAIFLAGPVGVGTVLIAVMVGPLIQLFYKPMEKWMSSLDAMLK